MKLKQNKMLPKLKYKIQHNNNLWIKFSKKNNKNLMKKLTNYKIR